MNSDLQAIAQKIINAQDTASVFLPEASLGHDLELDQAYEVSFLVHEHRLRQGWKPMGRKIGFTNSDMWALFGVSQPIWSFVYEQTLVDLSTDQFECNLDYLAQPKIEPELVLAIKQSPMANGSDDQTLGCLSWVAHGIEMVQCHYPDWKFNCTDAVCDASFHARLFVGKKHPIKSSDFNQHAMLSACAVNLLRGNQLIETGYGRNVLGNPLAALRSLVAAIESTGNRYPLLPGELITTGTMTKAYSVMPGENWTTQFEDNIYPGLKINFSTSKLANTKEH